MFRLESLSVLTPRMRQFSIRVKVINVQVVVETKLGNSIIQVAEFMVADQSACILLKIKNEWIEKLHVGKTYRIDNCWVEVFRGKMRIVTDKTCVVTDEGSECIGDVNLVNNLSQVEYVYIPKI